MIDERNAPFRDDALRVARPTSSVPIRTTHTGGPFRHDGRDECSIIMGHDVEDGLHRHYFLPAGSEQVVAEPGDWSVLRHPEPAGDKLAQRYEVRLGRNLCASM